jgi:hypothetical protein
VPFFLFWESVLFRDDMPGWLDWLGYFGLGFAGRCQVIRNHLVFVEANAAGVGANKSPIEDPSGKLVKMVFFQGAQETRSYFGRQGDCVQRNAALLTLLL